MTMMKLLLEADILPVILLVVDVHATDDQEQDPRRKLQKDNLYQPACNWHRHNVLSNSKYAISGKLNPSGDVFPKIYGYFPNKIK